MRLHQTIDSKPTITTYMYAVTLASLLVAIGIFWDVSWHISIGRDKFLSPPHILIYLGAMFGGLLSGIQVLLNTFNSSPETKNSFVKVWGIFYSPLGALFCIWGAVAMLTSAPFDNWWHNAYGLDFKIFSPPHILLAFGIFFLQFGTCAGLSKYINQPDPANKPLSIAQFLFIIAASGLMCMVYFFGTSFLQTREMRTSHFYQAITAMTLILLPAFGRALDIKWGMTAIAVCYFLIVSTTNWTLQLFPAEPRLGPILTHVTHFQPANFPLLLMVPTVPMDYVMQKKNMNDWNKAVYIAVIFVLLLLAVQYPLSGFLLESPGARNWFFGSESWYFGNAPDAPFRYKFRPDELEPLLSLARGIGVAIIAGLLSSRLSLRWGNWMRSIQR